MSIHREQLLETHQESFPLLDLECHTSIHAGPVKAYFRAEGYMVELCRVPYEFQKSGGQMMRIYQ